LGRSFTASGCLGVCTSTISQEDADLCAARQAISCTLTPPPNNPPDLPPVCATPGGCSGGGGTIPLPPPPPPPIIFSNEPQTCCVSCPDGTQFCFTTPSGTFVAGSVAQANAQAKSYACKRANQLLLCIIGTFPPSCTDEAFTATLSAKTGIGSDYHWTLVAGSLPPGLALSGTNTPFLTISGTPTATGTYTFTLKVTDGGGNFMQKTYSIVILAITSGTPPDASLNQPYSFQFTAGGGLPPYSFVVANGQLPDGLSLTTGGLLSGTPTTSESVNFTVCVTDSS